MKRVLNATRNVDYLLELDNRQCVIHRTIFYAMPVMEYENRKQYFGWYNF